MWFPHFRRVQHAMNMNLYAYVELADIHFICGLANGNGRVAVQLYCERYPTSREPNHQAFTRVIQNLAEHVSFRATAECIRRLWTNIFEEGVLYSVGRNTSTTVQESAVATGWSQTSIHRILKGGTLHHVQRVKLLQPDDHPRRVPFR